MQQQATTHSTAVHPEECGTVAALLQLPSAFEVMEVY
jgi:hypothetical protein